MSAATTMSTVIKSTPHLALLSADFFWMYITLGRRVHKTRKAFEKQLISSGMSATDAKRVSACFDELKNNITGMLKLGVQRSPPKTRKSNLTFI